LDQSCRKGARREGLEAVYLRVKSSLKNAAQLVIKFHTGLRAVASIYADLLAREQYHEMDWFKQRFLAATSSREIGWQVNQSEKDDQRQDDTSSRTIAGVARRSISVIKSLVPVANIRCHGSGGASCSSRRVFVKH